MSWRVHHLVERPIRSAVALVLMAAFCALVAWSFEPVFVPLSVAFFLVSLAPFLFPTHYELTPEGPCRRILGVTTTRRWSEFRSFAWGRDGVRLNTAPGPTRLGNLRGFSLRFASNREEVLAYIARHLPVAGARAAATPGAPEAAPVGRMGHGPRRRATASPGRS